MKNSFISIGFTKKTFGTQGDLKVKIEDAFLEDALKSDVLFLEIHKKKVPFFTENLRVTNNLLLKLEDIDSKEEAIPLTSKEIFLREEDVLKAEEREFEVEEEELEFKRFIGYQIDDENFGEVGKIENIEEYPQQEMAIVNFQNREILIPMHDNLILKIDNVKKQILMNLPEGILNLE